MAEVSDAVGCLTFVVATLLWDANERSHSFSQAYDETWVEKLYRGAKRHISMPFRFVCFVDRERKFKEPIEQMPIVHRPLDYGCCIEPYKLNEPMLLIGLDTLFVANCDKFVRWCLDNPGKLALPKHPYEVFSINGVSLWGGHNPDIYANWRGENDMDWVRQFPHERIDELWPGKVKSYRAHVMTEGVGKARLVYFHGRKKFNELLDDPFIKANWR